MHILWLNNECRQVQNKYIVFLGILIDSVSMTVRFDLISSKSIRIELEVYLNILLTDKQLEIQDIRPICGKFNWFAEVVTSCWTIFDTTSPLIASINLLRVDLQCWIALLSSYCRNGILPPPWYIGFFQSRVWLETHTQCMWFNLMDMSTFTSTYISSNATEVHYISKRWDGILKDSRNSIYFELRSLSDFLDNSLGLHHPMA